MLSEVKIAPGINKQVTPTGAQGKWIVIMFVFVMVTQKR